MGLSSPAGDVAGNKCTPFDLLAFISAALWRSCFLKNDTNLDFARERERGTERERERERGKEMEEMREELHTID